MLLGNFNARRLWLRLLFLPGDFNTQSHHTPSTISFTIKPSPVHISFALSSFVSETDSQMNPTTKEILKAINQIQLLQVAFLAGHITLSKDLKSILTALASRYNSLSLETTELHNKDDFLKS